MATKNPRGQERPRDGRGRKPGGRGAGRNTKPCKGSGPGYGKGGGRGGGRGR